VSGPVLKKPPARIPVGGEVLTPLEILGRVAMTAGPGVLWIALFLVLPGLLLFGYAFLTRDELGNAVFPLTNENFVRFAGWDALGDYDPAYWLIVGRSIMMAIGTTLFSALCSYPLSFFIAAHGPKTRNLLLTLVVVPSWINLVIRTYGWMILFSPNTFLSNTALSLGWLKPDEGLYPSEFAIYIGMVYTFFPFFVLPLYAAVERIDWTLLEAAQDLYASRWQAFVQVIVPQTLPGLVAGCILTAIPAFGMFVIPDLLGGAKVSYIGNSISQQFGTSRDWPFGAAISFLVMALTLAILAFYSKRAGAQGMRDLL
jgi:spermidine/putrescine transport system permease protein